MRCLRFAVAIFLSLMIAPFSALSKEQAPLCLDGFCIGQSIRGEQFDKVKWETPRKDLLKTTCSGVGCSSSLAFYGYPPELQKQLTDALSWAYGANQYNVVTNDNLSVLRHYEYECDQSARGMLGERRFVGFYKSSPNGYLTIVGLRLIDGQLKTYRIARRFPYNTLSEIRSLAANIRGQYGDRILLYKYLASNAYSDVIAQKKEGWFGRSELFNPSDLSNNFAEVVLIDPSTRELLEPTSMPESGEIAAMPAAMDARCNRPMPIQ